MLSEIPVTATPATTPEPYHASEDGRLWNGVKLLTPIPLPEGEAAHLARLMNMAYAHGRCDGKVEGGERIARVGGGL